MTMLIKIEKIALFLILAFCLVWSTVNDIKVLAAGNSDIIFSKSPKPTKKIALTFDDGPHPYYTEEILNILNEYNVKATFFVIGINIQNYPGPLKKIYENGHEIGNHSFSHKDLSMGNTLQELKSCEEMIFRTVGIRPRLFRPPRGYCNETIDVAARELEYTQVLWSIDTLDWKHTPPKEISEKVLSRIQGGDIILMHDYTSGKNTTIDALKIILPELLSQGYEFVTVSQLIKQ